ncbi:hypothetical protein HNV12_19285 [Methanococcoides sp. SA1]|nr:hypothetical protein [Methanococcoides sp. SA1]
MSIYQNRSKLPWTPLFIGLLRSDTFKQLKNSSKVLYFYLRAAHSPNKNNKSGEIEVRLSYTEIQKIRGFSTKTIKRCLDELIDADLIEKTEQGGMLGNCNVYSFKGKYSHFFNKKRKRKGK